MLFAFWIIKQLWKIINLACIKTCEKINSVCASWINNDKIFRITFKNTKILYMCSISTPSLAGCWKWESRKRGEWSYLQRHFYLKSHDLPTTPSGQNTKLFFPRKPANFHVGTPSRTFHQLYVKLYVLLLLYARVLSVSFSPSLTFSFSVFRLACERKDK
jgi:hypothetical protein